MAAGRPVDAPPGAGQPPPPPDPVRLEAAARLLAFDAPGRVVELHAIFLIRKAPGLTPAAAPRAETRRPRRRPSAALLPLADPSRPRARVTSPEDRRARGGAPRSSGSAAAAPPPPGPEADGTTPSGRTDGPDR